MENLPIDKLPLRPWIVSGDIITDWGLVRGLRKGRFFDLVIKIKTPFRSREIWSNDPFRANRKILLRQRKDFRRRRPDCDRLHDRHRSDRHFNSRLELRKLRQLSAKHFVGRRQRVLRRQAFRVRRPQRHHVFQRLLHLSRWGLGSNIVTDNPTVQDCWNFFFVIKIFFQRLKFPSL